MIHIREAILVEGRYDANKLRQIVDTVIIETSGFAIFKDKEKLQMIRRIAAKRGILVLTDSDSAGFVIRNFIKGAIPKEQVRHAYIPEIMGKERRKRAKSKEGLLGVEGMDDETIRQAMIQAGATFEESAKERKLVKADLYELGLSGVGGSAERRAKLLKALKLPKYMSSNALLDFINAVSDYDAVHAELEKIDREQENL